MKSKFISAAVVAVAALTCLGASAETFNSFVFDQMAAPLQKTRAEVKADIAPAASAHVQHAAVTNASSGSSYYGALAQQQLDASAAQNANVQAQTQTQLQAGAFKTSQK